MDENAQVRGPLTVPIGVTRLVTEDGSIILVDWDFRASRSPEVAAYTVASRVMFRRAVLLEFLYRNGHTVTSGDGTSR